MAKVNQDGPVHPDLGTSCWDWTASLRNGYPQFTDAGGQIVGGHRWSLERKIGRRLRPDEVARHLCDRRTCVNPDHLEAGTYAENSADMVSRGRTGVRTGRRGPTTADDVVLAIREAYARGMSGGQLAIRYGMSATAVNNIASGARRASVGGPFTQRRKAS